MLPERLPLRVCREEFGQHQEDEEVQQHVGNDEGEFQADEPDRPLLLPEAAEHDGLEGILRHYEGHAAYVFGVIGISQGARDGVDEAQHQGDESQARQPDQAQGGAVHHFAVLAVLVGEAEQGGLHAEGEDDQKQGRIGVQIGYDAVAAAFSRYLDGVERNEQVVEETPDYTAEAVEGRIFCKGFQIHLHKNS